MVIPPSVDGAFTLAVANGLNRNGEKFPGPQLFLILVAHGGRRAFELPDLSSTSAKDALRAHSFAVQISI